MPIVIIKRSQHSPKSHDVFIVWVRVRIRVRDRVRVKGEGFEVRVGIERG